MKKIVRPLDLVNSKDVLFMEIEENPLNIKDGIHYVHQKTKSFNDSQFRKWLENQQNSEDGRDIEELKRDVFKPEFAYMQKKVNELIAARSYVIDLLLDQNGMMRGVEVKHIIEDF